MVHGAGSAREMHLERRRRDSALSQAGRPRAADHRSADGHWPSHTTHLGLSLEAKQLIASQRRASAHKLREQCHRQVKHKLTHFSLLRNIQQVVSADRAGT